MWFGGCCWSHFSEALRSLQWLDGIDLCIKRDTIFWVWDVWRIFILRLELVHSGVFFNDNWQSFFQLRFLVVSAMAFINRMLMNMLEESWELDRIGEIGIRYGLWMTLLKQHLEWAADVDETCKSSMSTDSEELMQGAVGKKPSRLAKTEPFIKCNTCHLVSQRLEVAFYFLGSQGFSQETCFMKMDGNK